METSPLPEDEPTRADPGRPEWRSLSHLRDRVEAAVREIERLRSENAALAKRLIELQDAREDAPSFAFGEGEDPDAIRGRVQGFIDLVDGILQETAGDGAAGEPAETP